MKRSQSHRIARCSPYLVAALTLVFSACQGDTGGVVSSDESAPTAAQSAIADTNLSGSNLGGVNLGGPNLGGVNLSGPNLGGSNLAGTNLAGANLGGTNLAGPNLAGNNLAGTNLAGANLAGANLAGANLAGTNLAGSNLSGSNLAGANLAGSNLAGTNLSGTDLSSSEAGLDFHLLTEWYGQLTTTGTWTGASDGNAYGGGYRYATAAATMTIPFWGVGATVYAARCSACGKMKIKLDGAVVSVVDLYVASDSWRRPVYTTPPGLTNAAHTITLEWTGTKNASSTGTRVNFDALRVNKGGNQMLRSGEDMFHVQNKTSPTNSACVVMGIGSTAFTRLVTANPGNQMFALINKLPWGLTRDPSTGVELEAWEAIVWGSDTYCVFVVPAPVGSTYAGVGGFIKAIFRWNAPPSKTISIGQIGGGVAPVTYKGMMNAAALFATGRLSDANLISAQLSFITATTNNISVNVDFASYVLTNDSNFTVLGNPSVIANTTQYPEGVYGTAVYDDAGGEKTYRVVSFSPQSSGIYYDTIAAAYEQYVSSLGTAKPLPMPEPKRCLGAKFLLKTRGVAIPAGKCDSGLWFLDLDRAAPVNLFSWTLMPGSVTNALTSDLTVARGVTIDMTNQPLVGGTHVFLNEVPYK